MPYDNLVYDQFIDEYVLLLFFIIDLHDGRKYKSGDDAYIDAKEPIDVRPYGSCHTSVFGSPGKTSDLMASAIRRSLPKVKSGKFGLPYFSPHDLDHMASGDAMHRSLPGDDTGQFFDRSVHRVPGDRPVDRSGDVTGHRSPVIDRSGHDRSGHRACYAR